MGKVAEQRALLGESSKSDWFGKPAAGGSPKVSPASPKKRKSDDPLADLHEELDMALKPAAKKQDAGTSDQSNALVHNKLGAAERARLRKERRAAEAAQAQTETTTRSESSASSKKPAVPAPELSKPAPSKPDASAASAGSKKKKKRIKRALAAVTTRVPERPASDEVQTGSRKKRKKS